MDDRFSCDWRSLFLMLVVFYCYEYNFYALQQTESMKRILSAIGYAIASIVVILAQSLKRQISFIISFFRFIFFGIFLVLFISFIFDILNPHTLLLIVFLFEIVLKILWLRSYQSLKFIPTKPDDWDFLDIEKLNRYTTELEELGFVQLLDCSLCSRQAMARFLVHPQEYCFAEIYQLKNMPMFYSLSSHLEQNWSLVVSIAKPNPISYIFSHQSRNLIKHIVELENNSPSVLFNILLQWRPKILSDLKISFLRDIRVECHMQWQDRMMQANRKALLKKSMIVALIEIIRFTSKPKIEWLGEYEKLQKKL